MSTAVVSEELAACRMAGCEAGGAPAGADCPGGQVCQVLRCSLAAGHGHLDGAAGERVTRGHRPAARQRAWRRLP